jgi:hypothetical protein
MKRVSVKARRWLAGATTAGLVAAGLGMTAAQAGTTPPWDVTDTVVHTAAQNFDDPEGNTKELGPINGKDYKVLTIHDTPTPVLGKTNPNAGTDMTQVWVDSAADSESDIWGYFAFEIESFTTGQSAWEFMKDPAPEGCDYSQSDAHLVENCNPWENREAGDFFIVADYQGNSVELRLREWARPGGAGTPLVLGDPEPIPAEFGSASINTDTGIVEMAVNLTDAVFGGIEQCVTIGNIIPSTVTGNSDQADYKDVVLAGIADAVKISNCGSVEIIKKLDPATATVPDGNDFDWTLERSDGTELRYDGTTDLTGTLAGHDDSSGALDDLIVGKDYELTEDINGAAFSLHSIVCTLDGNETDITTGGTFKVAVSKTTECIITNEENAGDLIVKKTVVNDNGGQLDREDFSFDVAGPTASTGNVFESDGQNDLTVDAGTYSVAELAAQGYNTTYANSQNSDATCTDLDVPNGESVTCTITNDDEKASPDGTTVQSWVLHDQLTLDKLRTGASNAGDSTVTFQLYSDNVCSIQVGEDEAVGISDGVAGTSAGVTVENTGLYYWVAEYSGDKYNKKFTTSCGDEITQIQAKDAKGDGRDDIINP